MECFQCELTAYIPKNQTAIYIKDVLSDQNFTAFTL
jgi:hypothetical protein